jgi:HD-like signal output (HDOD) protein/ActR/RegA family two-component response regulator
VSNPRILFVDDEIAILDALRGLFRRERKRWDMVFATGGRAALAELDGQRFDVIVTDMRMPEVDGAAVLHHARKRHPSSIRIVLTGHAEAVDLAKVAPLTHQILAKPCEHAVLHGVLERACTAASNLPAIDGHSIAWFGELPAPPSTYLDLRRLAGDPRSQASAITAVIQRDVGLAARILALANSAYIGVRQPVSNLGHAIGYVGLELLSAMVLVNHLEQLAGARRVPAATIARVSAHALATAALARQLHPGDDADVAFAAGLLHDLGCLVLATFAEAEAGAGAAAPPADLPGEHGDGPAQLAAEQARYGIDHAAAGAHLLRLWGLPAPLVDAIARHHDPTLACASPLAAVVHAASRLADEPGAALPGELEAALAHPDALARWRAGAGAR